MDDLDTIAEYNWNNLPKYSTTVFIASRRSGKSVMMRSVIYNEIIKKRKIKDIIVVSPTEFNQDYAFLPKKSMFTQFDDEFLQQILDRQSDAIKRDPMGNYDVVLVLDDILGSTNKKTKDTLSRLFTLSRHYRLYIFMAVQSIRFEYTPLCRLNTDIVVLFKSNSYDNKKEIRDLWLGFTEKGDRDKGFEILDEVAQGYRTMIIDNTKTSKNIGEFCYHYTTDINRSVPANYNLD